MIILKNGENIFQNKNPYIFIKHLYINILLEVVDLWLRHNSVCIGMFLLTQLKIVYNIRYYRGL